MHFISFPSSIQIDQRSLSDIQVCPTQTGSSISPSSSSCLCAICREEEDTREETWTRKKKDTLQWKRNLLHEDKWEKRVGTCVCVCVCQRFAVYTPFLFVSGKGKVRHDQNKADDDDQISFKCPWLQARRREKSKREKCQNTTDAVEWTLPARLTLFYMQR